MAALALLWRLFSTEIGVRYRNEQHFFQAQQDAGWQEMGRFSQSLDFPAHVSKIQQARGSIRFRLPDGIQHEYSGFDGRDFKLFTFQPDDPAKSAFVLLMARKQPRH